jgi:hypothetical protein
VRKLPAESSGNQAASGKQQAVSSRQLTESKKQKAGCSGLQQAEKDTLLQRESGGKRRAIGGPQAAKRPQPLAASQPQAAPISQNQQLASHL